MKQHRKSQTNGGGPGCPEGGGGRQALPGDRVSIARARPTDLWGVCPTTRGIRREVERGRVGPAELTPGGTVRWNSPAGGIPVAWPVSGQRWRRWTGGGRRAEERQKRQAGGGRTHRRLPAEDRIPAGPGPVTETLPSRAHKGDGPCGSLKR